MIRRATLYLPSEDDTRAALLSVAARPVAFRVVLAAVRAGATRVAVPAALRVPSLERALAAAPATRAAAVWCDGPPAGEAPVLLVPANGLTSAPALAALLAAGPPGVLEASRGTGAPVVAADASLLSALGSRVSQREAMGAALEGALAGGSVAARAPEAWYVRVRTGVDAAEAERRLYAGLGSPIDTALDLVLHRRLSRLVTRVAMAWSLTPNQVSLASLLVGLVAAWCVWGATPLSALVGLATYVVAVVLDHSDGEVARLAAAESVLGGWLDILVDTAVHALMVLGLGATAEAVAGTGAALGVAAAVGVVVSAILAKLRPVAADAVGEVLVALGSRDGFYAMLVAFLLARTLRPDLLPALMIVVAVGSNLYWLARLAHLLFTRLR